MPSEHAVTLSSLLRAAKIGSISAPPGDPGEQLIALAILSSIAAHLNTLSNAKMYISQAYAIAERLACRTPTYRTPVVSKFARITFETGGKPEMLLCSIINGTLVMPVVEPQDIVWPELPTLPAVDVRAVNVAYFRLHLRPTRLAISLQCLIDMTSSEELASATDVILRECLSQAITSIGPLDIVNDCFMLAHSLIGLANFPLAALALKSADTTLEEYMQRKPVGYQPEALQLIKKEITEVSRQLTDGGS